MYTPHFCTIQNISNSTTFSIQCTASYYEASCYFIIMRSTHLSSWSAIILIYYLQKGAEVHEYVVLMCWIGMKSMYQYTYTKHINYFIVCPTNTWTPVYYSSIHYVKQWSPLCIQCQHIRCRLSGCRIIDIWQMAHNRCPLLDLMSCFNHPDLYHCCLWPLSLLWVPNIWVNQFIS